MGYARACSCSNPEGCYKRFLSSALPPLTYEPCVSHRYVCGDSSESLDGMVRFFEEEMAQLDEDDDDDGGKRGAGGRSAAAGGGGKRRKSGKGTRGNGGKGGASDSPVGLLLPKIRRLLRQSHRRDKRAAKATRSIIAASTAAAAAAEAAVAAAEAASKKRVTRGKIAATAAAEAASKAGSAAAAGGGDNGTNLSSSLPPLPLSMVVVPMVVDAVQTSERDPLENRQRLSVLSAAWAASNSASSYTFGGGASNSSSNRGTYSNPGSGISGLGSGDPTAGTEASSMGPPIPAGLVGRPLSTAIRLGTLAGGDGGVGRQDEVSSGPSTRYTRYGDEDYTPNKRGRYRCGVCGNFKVTDEGLSHLCPGKNEGALYISTADLLRKSAASAASAFSSSQSIDLAIGGSSAALGNGDDRNGDGSVTFHDTTYTGEEMPGDMEEEMEEGTDEPLSGGRPLGTPLGVTVTTSRPSSPPSYKMDRQAGNTGGFTGGTSQSISISQCLFQFCKFKYIFRVCTVHCARMF